MSERYRIFGSELSPYSIKVRSYFRYKQLPHEWVIRDLSKMEEFKRYAKLPLVPLVVTPDDQGIQDSTPIIEAMEGQTPEPGIQPSDERAAFVSVLLEEYADEWGNKPMFHYRWWYPENQASAAERIAREQLGPDAEEKTVNDTIQFIQDRMVSRLSFVGSNETNKPIIEGSFKNQLTLLEKHLSNRDYLFGGKPAMADFGWYAQLYECYSDPYNQAYIEQQFPTVMSWLDRMLDPRATGEWESWEALEPSLLPILEQEVAQLFLPWSTANAKALEAGEKTFRCDLNGQQFEQEAQKYHAKSLKALKEKFQLHQHNEAMINLLHNTGCLAFLK